MTVLIADDERTIREGLAKSIDWKGMGVTEVLLAADGREAFELIEDRMPDLAVLDIIMPEMTGIELVEAYKNDPDAPRFVLLSGYSEFDYARKALRNNVADYLLKPCDLDEITASVGGLLAKIREEKSLKREDILSSLENLDPESRLRLLRPFISGGAFPGPEQLQGGWPEEYSPSVRKALDYIRGHLSDPGLSLHQIAREVLFLNPDYLGKLIKKEVGARFSSVLTTMRMNEAMRLLGGSGERMKIYEVAARVGLGGNVTYFSQAFKKVTGVLPTQYARGVLGDEKGRS